MYEDDDDPFAEDRRPTHQDALDDLDFEDEGDEGNFMRWLSIAFILCAVGGFIALAWYAYQSSIQPISEDEIPMVEAEERPLKVEPEEPGGWQFQHQDKSVYNELAAGQEGDRPVAERLLPAPEEPVQRPPVEELLSQQAQPEPVRKAEPQQPETLIAPEQAAPTKVESDVVETADIMPETKPEPVAEPVAEPTPAPTPKVEAKPTPKPTPAAKPAAAPAASISSGEYIIQLGAFRSEADANAAWSKVTSAHGTRFSSKQKRIERADLGAKGVFYRLQAGPYSGEDAAKAECAYLQQHKQGCFAVKVQ